MFSTRKRFWFGDENTEEFPRRSRSPRHELLANSIHGDGRLGIGMPSSSRRSSHIYGGTFCWVPPDPEWIRVAGRRSPPGVRHGRGIQNRLSVRSFSLDRSCQPGLDLNYDERDQITHRVVRTPCARRPEVGRSSSLVVRPRVTDGATIVPRTAVPCRFLAGLWQRYRGDERQSAFHSVALGTSGLDRRTGASPRRA